MNSLWSKPEFELVSFYEVIKAERELDWLSVCTFWFECGSA